MVLVNADKTTLAKRLIALSEPGVRGNYSRLYKRLKVLFKEDEVAARRGLEALARAHLIERESEYGRWRMHDLVRLFAAEYSDRHARTDSRAKAFRCCSSTISPRRAPLPRTWTTPSRTGQLGFPELRPGT